MIVVAIIGILAAVALPQYQNYVTKAKWSTNVVAADTLKIAISECLQTKGGVVASCDELGELQTAVGFGDGTAAPTAPHGTIKLIKASGTGDDAVAAAIEITGNADVGTCVVTITPTISATAGSVTWTYITSGDDCTIAQTGYATS